MPKIVRFHSLGPAEVLKIEDVDLEKPGPGEIRLAVKAIGLNRAEILFHEGRYLEVPELPSRIGYEAAGFIDAIGEGVDGLRVGDYVSTIPCFSQSRYGVYGEQAVVPASAVAKVPEGLTPAQAASIWMQYLTAYGALVEIGGLSAGQVVLITAASSSVGLAAIQVAKDTGAIAIATTRSQSKKDVLLEQGANQVVVSESENLVEKVRGMTAGKGVDLVFDAVAGPLVVELAKATKYEGTMIVYGALSLARTPFPLQIALKKGLNMRGYTMFQITNDAVKLKRSIEFISARLESGAYTPVIDREFKLDQIAEAHRYMETNQQIGKIVVTCD